MKTTRKRDESIPYFKSFFTDDGIRYRYLRKKEADRFEYIGLKKNKDGYSIAYIYTVEQALDLGIKFRSDWEKPKPDTEKVYFSSNSYCQKDDWVITEEPGVDGEYWVMQVLWRNDNVDFPHIRTATGTYVPSRKKYKPFDGNDLLTQYRAGTKREYEESNWLYGGLTPKEKLLVTFVVNLIMQHGYFSYQIMKMAYNQAYTGFATIHKISNLMQSNKIMTKVAEKLSEKLQSNHMEHDWVLAQLKSMGENDFEADPKRRERVVRLVGAMNEMPMYEEQHVRAVGSPKSNADIEAENDLKMLESGK